MEQDVSLDSRIQTVEATWVGIYLHKFFVAVIIIVILGVEKGTIHTKRHSGEDPLKYAVSKSESATKIGRETSYSPNNDEPRIFQDIFPNTKQIVANEKIDVSVPQPHPLPMPEYGGYFAPLTEYLPESSQPISGFHRCNVAVMLLCDVVVDGIQLDWTVQVPLMLHILFLGMDHTRPLVHQHCKQLLLNLLIVLARHSDHLAVAHIMLNNKTNQLGLGLPTPSLPVINHNFTGLCTKLYVSVIRL